MVPEFVTSDIVEPDGLDRIDLQGLSARLATAKEIYADEFLGKARFYEDGHNRTAMGTAHNRELRPSMEFSSTLAAFDIQIKLSPDAPKTILRLEYEKVSAPRTAPSDAARLFEIGTRALDAWNDVLTRCSKTIQDEESGTESAMQRWKSDLASRIAALIHLHGRPDGGLRNLSIIPPLPGKSIVVRNADNRDKLFDPLTREGIEAIASDAPNFLTLRHSARILHLVDERKTDVTPVPEYDPIQTMQTLQRPMMRSLAPTMLNAIYRR